MQLFITGVNHLGINDRWMVKRGVEQFYKGKKIERILITDSSNPINAFASLYAIEIGVHYRVFHRRYDKFNSMSVPKTLETGRRINSSAPIDRDRLAIRKADEALFIWDGKMIREKKLIEYCQLIKKKYKIFWCKDKNGENCQKSIREEYQCQLIN